MTTGRTHRYSHFPVIGCHCHACNYCRDKIGMADAPAEGTPELLQGFDTMTTTPDSRIRSDFGLPPGVPTRAQAGHLVDQMTPQLRAEMEAYWARAEPIDTSTTAGRIAVMQAWEEGRDIEVAVLGGDSPWRKAHGGLNNLPNGEWDWKTYDYRIAPPPAPRTALQRARAHVLNWTGAHNPDSLRLEPLLREIDSSPLVIISMRTVGLGAEATPYPTIAYWVDGDPKSMQPGRYRLLRDDQ